MLVACAGFVPFMDTVVGSMLPVVSCNFFNTSNRPFVKNSNFLVASARVLFVRCESKSTCDSLISIFVFSTIVREHVSSKYLVSCLRQVHVDLVLDILLVFHLFHSVRSVWSDSASLLQLVYQNCYIAETKVHLFA